MLSHPEKDRVGLHERFCVTSSQRVTNPSFLIRYLPTPGNTNSHLKHTFPVFLNMANSKLPEINRYIDPLTDFGFKRIFGSDPNKDLLIDLLNSVLVGKKHIIDLVYNKNEHPGETKEIGSAIFDLTCTGQNGERMIIEVQRGRQANFKQRAIYYTSQMIAGQAPRGKRAAWAYQLPEVYLIALLEDFSVETTDNGRYVQDICLINRDTGKVFYEGLNYIFLELVNFVKAEEELETELDKWLYVLKNMGSMDKIPVFLRKPIFKKLFSIAEYTNMTKEEQLMYNTALKHKWDNQNILDYAVKEAEMKGIEKGIEKGRREERAKADAEKRKILTEAKAEKVKIALTLKTMGMPVNEIAKVVGLGHEEIEQL